MPKLFVYGAQMIHPESLGVTSWPARVRGHTVEFMARGIPVFEPAFAELEPVADPHAAAYGVVVEFSDSAWAELVRHESGYAVVEVEAELLDPSRATELGASSLRCHAFRLLERERLATPGRPSARYARKLVAGARAHGLPPDVIARYEQAAAQGGRASLALAWLYPFASRVGLGTTALLLALVVATVVIALVAWLT
ncbi:hypothetical protein ACNOYE_28220 [Nannocystaceae bacterium ST9]